jgi:hypothetical protein
LPTAAEHFRRGVAPVRSAQPRTRPVEAPHEPTGTGWPDEPDPRLGPPLSAQLRRGARLTFWAAAFAFTAWGLWLLSGHGDLFTAVVVYAVVLTVAAGLFALSRLLGRLVLERRLGRVRRSARGAHLVASVFLAAVGVGFLRQTGWVLDAWHWMVG